MSYFPLGLCWEEQDLWEEICTHRDPSVSLTPPKRAGIGIWHDRAVFHFLTKPEDRAAYVERIRKSVRPGGHVIVGTFGPEGLVKCSGLDVQRYDAESLHVEFGGRFRLIDSVKELHQTPFGTTQQFVYCFCLVE